jgi:hypothetical protein
MNNKDSVGLSVLFLCFIVSVSFVFLSICITPIAVQASQPSPNPLSTEEDYTDVPIDKVINPALSAQIAKKWIRFKAKFSMTVPDMADLPKEYQDGWVRISVIDPDDVLACTVNVAIPEAKSDIVSELKYGDVIEVFAYGKPIKTTVFERTVNRILYIVNKIKKVK